VRHKEAILLFRDMTTQASGEASAVNGREIFFSIEEVSNQKDKKM